MTTTEVLLQILVVALDAPTLVGNVDQVVDRRVFWHCEEVFARPNVACWALDEQPLFGTQACLARIAAGVALPHGRKAAVQCVSLVPSRQLMFWDARLGSDCAGLTRRERWQLDGIHTTHCLRGQLRRFICSWGTAFRAMKGPQKQEVDFRVKCGFSGGDCRRFA
jgi:hypothetical protein